MKVIYVMLPHQNIERGEQTVNDKLADYMIQTGHATFVSVAEPDPTPDAVDVAEVEPVVDNKVVYTEPSPSMLKSELLAMAWQYGLDVSEQDTKTDILDAIRNR